jgi:prepilin-type N-terminal cleavage/methylation domain-containing protein
MNTARRPISLWSAASARTGGRAAARRRGHSGFTLVEVLAALLLVGIVLPAIMEGISLSQQAGRIARTSLEATALAEAKLNEIVAGGQWNSGAGSGDFGEDHPGYRWEMQVTDRGNNVSEVDVRVTWIVRMADRSVMLSTFVYNTANSTTGGSTGMGTQ